MTIRLTSVVALDKVLEKLKQDEMYSEEVNESFFKYCLDDIKSGIIAGDDEWYLDIDWLPESRYTTKYGVALVIRYRKRSEIMTDEEYVSEDK